MNELPQRLRQWKQAGEFFDSDGVRLFYQFDESAGPERDVLVLFHGFPTSSWDWHAVLPALNQRWRTLVFDFPGYGLSDKPPGFSYSLLRQFDAAQALIQHLGIHEFDLLAHDMGNSVACELLYRREKGNLPFTLRSLTLLNGGVYMDLHRPLITQRMLRTPVLGAMTARLSSWRMFRHQYPKVYAQPEHFDESHYEEQWSLMQHNHGRRTLAAVAGYMRERVKMGDRWLGPLHRLDLPFRLLWGKQDPIAVYAIALRLVANNPKAQLNTLEGVGHYPQLEAPQLVTELIHLAST